MRRPRRQIWLAVLLALAVLTTGCSGASDSKATRGQQLADELFPGQLKVVDVVTDVGGPVPVPIRRLVFAVVADSEAGFTLDRLDAGMLRKAYAKGQQDAAEFRALQPAVRAAGLDLVGYRVTDNGQGTSFTIAADVTDLTISALTGRLDRALAAWSAARRTDPALSGPMRLSFSIVPAAAPAAAPPVRERWPRVLQVDDPRRQDVISRSTTLYGRVGLDRQDRPRPVGAQLRPALDEAKAKQVDAEVAELAGDWLREQRPDLRLGLPDPLIPHLEVGSTTRLRTYTYACPPGTAQCYYGSPYLVALTIDLTTRQRTEVKLLKKPAGGWPNPVEPDPS